MKSIPLYKLKTKYKEFFLQIIPYTLRKHGSQNWNTHFLLYSKAWHFYFHISGVIEHRKDLTIQEQ